MISIERGMFADRADVLDDVKNSGYWPTTFVSGPSPGLPPHWHDDEVHAYVIEGATWFLDAETGQRHEVSAGDKVIIPAGTLHAEGEVVDRVVYIVALPVPKSGRAFLAMRTNAAQPPANPPANGKVPPSQPTEAAT